MRLFYGSNKEIELVLQEETGRVEIRQGEMGLFVPSTKFYVDTSIHQIIATN